jgi:rod shape-determining protein MreD
MQVEKSLLSVKTRVVVVSLVVAWALSFLTVRQTAWLDWMGLILLFWTVYQPSRVTYGLAFVVGLLIDLQQTTIFGQHALMYVWMVFVMQVIAPRIRYSSVLIHALVATGLLFAAQLLRALGYLIFAGQGADLGMMLWIFIGPVAWLSLVWLLKRGTQSRTVGSWLAD